MTTPTRPSTFDGEIESHHQSSTVMNPDSDKNAREQAGSDGGGIQPPAALAYRPDALTPRMVIRGERPLPDTSNKAGNPNSALTDWLNVTFPLSNQPVEISKFLDAWVAVAGKNFKGLVPLNRGHAG